MANRSESPSYQRYHIVLIPGFGGFDALGQVEYYSGITDLFQRWKQANGQAGKPVVLHYFDNFPTAAVVTRADRLRQYLAKRFARGEILPDDEIALVGHSTGGLDIRQLVCNLDHSRAERIYVDGGHGVSVPDLRRCLRRVVFLSVPHWGTNIADWVHSHPGWRRVVVANLQVAVAGSQVYPIDQLEQGLAGGAADLTDADFLRAVRDALTEADDHYGTLSPQRIAAAHEAASELALYVRHMASDFHVIEDLRSQRPEHGPQSPAHFNLEERAQELQRWDDPAIECLSYVTLGSRPFRFTPGQPAPVWELKDPWTYPEIQKDDKLSESTDIAYRLCYRACAGGPFRYPPTGLRGAVTRCLDGSSPGSIELWDNDGIVNTASMPWPRGDNVLVPGDHLDIVGQYKLIKTDPARGRQYQSYDTLRSVSPFNNRKSGDETLRKIWMEIFAFCVGERADSEGNQGTGRQSRRKPADRGPGDAG